MAERRVVDDMVEGWLLVDSNARCLDANAALAVHLGVPRETVPQRLLSALLPPDVGELVLRRVRACCDGASFDDALQCRVPAGQRDRWLEVRVRPCEEGAVLTTVDITGRHDAEEALARREETLRLALDGAQLGVWVNDLKTMEVHFDERAMRHYGFDRATVQLSDVLQRVDPEDVARLGGEIAAATGPTGSGRYATRYRVRHPDGSVHWLAVGVRVAFEVREGVRHAVVGYGTSADVTEEVRRVDELRELTRRAMRVREEEQARISRDLHDGLGQQLTALTLALSAIERELGATAPGNVVDRVVEASSLTRSTLSEMQRVARDLRPPLLETLGLGPALREEVKAFERRASVRGVTAIDDVEATPEVGIAVFRIVQEALTNVARHARASTVRVTLRSQAGALEASVEDDGVGLPARPTGSDAHHLGLRGMEERARALGGTLEVKPLPRGTMVRLVVQPHAAAPA